MSKEKLEKLLKRIHDRALRLAVIGSGYVGLPTATLFAEAGFHVTSVDVKPEIVNAINNGVSSINEPGLNELISQNVQANRLKATTNFPEALNKADAIIVSVQTPINRNKKPDLRFLEKALRNIGKNLKKETLLVISSTVPPGTILGKVKPTLESLCGLKTEEDFYLAYVPERIAPGKALKEFVESPRLIGGVGPNSTKISAELFKTVCQKVIETDAQTAEIAKLAENTFRDINIAFANQLAIICEKLNVDVMEVIKLANTHPRVNIHMLGPGVGGPCLPKDPYLLIHQAKQLKHDLIKTARKINDYMPEHIIKMTAEALKKAGKNLKNSKIAVLGTAYKADVDDSRGSPSKPIIQKLIKHGAKVYAFDPYCKETFGAEKVESLKQALEKADCTIILTDHAEFKNLNLQQIKALMNSNPVIIDGKRIVNSQEAERLGFFYYGIGYGKSKEATY